MLARREHSRLELSRKLLARDFPQQEVEEVLAQLQQEKLQSDERFVEAYVSMRANRGFGPVRIQQELQQRGIDHATAERFLDATDWQEKLTQVWRKKFSGRLPSDFAERAKQATFLQYRGFTVEQINCFIAVTIQVS